MWACPVGSECALSGVKLKSIIVQWRWWKVVQCLPTSADKALLFPLEGSDHSHTETDSHSQPEGRWDGLVSTRNIHQRDELTRADDGWPAGTWTTAAAAQWAALPTKVWVVISELTEHLVTFFFAQEKRKKKWMTGTKPVEPELFFHSSQLWQLWTRREDNCK